MKRHRMSNLADLISADGREISTLAFFRAPGSLSADKLHRVRDLVTPAVMAKYPKFYVEIDWVKGEVVMVGKGLGRRCTLYHCDEPYDLQLISDRIRVFAEQK